MVVAVVIDVPHILGRVLSGPGMVRAVSSGLCALWTGRVLPRLRRGRPVLDFAVAGSVHGRESQEAGADAGGQELQKPRYGVTQVDIVDNMRPKRLDRTVLEVKRDSDVILFCTEREGLIC